MSIILSKCASAMGRPWRLERTKFSNVCKPICFRQYVGLWEEESLSSLGSLRASWVGFMASRIQCNWWAGDQSWWEIQSGQIEEGCLRVQSIPNNWLWWYEPGLPELIFDRSNWKSSNQDVWMMTYSLLERSELITCLGLWPFGSHLNNPELELL